MTTFKPAYMQKGSVGSLDSQITKATFDCFATDGLYQGQPVQVTTDKDSVVFSNGEFQLDVTETIVCFLKCEVSDPCKDQTVTTCGETYLIDKVVHDDGYCVCVTVKKCGTC